MKDNQLRYALTAWKTQSFTGASETLNISQSAISQQIRLLENEIIEADKKGLISPGSIIDVEMTLSIGSLDFKEVIADKIKID